MKGLREKNSEDTSDAKDKIIFFMRIICVRQVLGYLGRKKNRCYTNANYFIPKLAPSTIVFSHLSLLRPPLMQVTLLD